MKKLLTWLSKRRFPYEPLVIIEISRSNLLHNLSEFRKLAPNGQIAPVLKSNAYGHGMFEVAEILENAEGTKVPFFVVDSYFEAVALRSHGIKTPLLIVGYTRAEMITHSKLKNVSFTVTSMATLHSLRKTKNTVRIHLKIDTGMHRQGIMPEEVETALEILKNNSQIVLEGLASHLCDTDNTDDAFTHSQILLWNTLSRKFNGIFPNTLKYLHLSATDGHRCSDSIEANLSRLGIGLYGLCDGKIFEPNLDLKPVLELKTIITGTKILKKNHITGYGKTFRAEKDTPIATIPVGYYEGLNSRLSNNGVVLVGPSRVPCPIIGRISMNITTIDISNIPEAKDGTPVVAISNIASDQNSIFEIAKKVGSISYEVAVKIPSHLKRVIVD